MAQRGKKRVLHDPRERGEKSRDHIGREKSPCLILREKSADQQRSKQRKKAIGRTGQTEKKPDSHPKGKGKRNLAKERGGSLIANPHF